MKESYLQKNFPANLYKPNHDTIKMIEGLLRIKDALTKAELGLEWTLRMTMELIEDVIGELKLGAELYHIPAWVIKYLDLWQRLIAAEMGGGFDEGQEFINALYNPVTQKYLDRMAPYLTEEDLKGIAGDLNNPWDHLIAHWHAMGRKEYTVSKGLSQKLRHTKLKGYPTANLCLPYGAIYINFQDYEDFGPTHVAGCLVTQTEMHISMAVIVTELVGRGTRVPQTLSLRRTTATLDEALSLAIATNRDHNFNMDTYEESWRALFSYIVNIILYATMREAESVFQYHDPTYTKLQKRLKQQKSPQKREKIKQQLKKITSSGYIYLGGTIKVDRTEEQQESQGFKGKWRITVRTLVSGHWRNQPCGTGKMDNKRIWIEPFWRGPEGAPITQKKHHLQ